MKIITIFFVFCCLLSLALAFPAAGQDTKDRNVMKYESWYRNHRPLVPEDLEGEEAHAVGHFGGHHAGHFGGNHVSLGGGLLGSAGNLGGQAGGGSVGNVGNFGGHFGLGGILRRPDRYRGRY